MVNQWVQFVKEFAKENNISYGCAISEAGPAYRNMKQGGNSKREKNERESMTGEDFDAPIKKVGKTSKNPWITFVKKYSQEKGIKYNEALREIKRLGLYNKSSMNGKGFGDLPDELQEKIGYDMDNNSLDNILKTNKRTNNNNGMKNELQKRSNKVQTDYQNLMILTGHLESWYNSVMMDLININDVDGFKDYYDRVVNVLHLLTKLKNDQLLTEQKRTTTRQKVQSLQRLILLMDKFIRQRKIYSLYR